MKNTIIAFSLLLIGFDAFAAPGTIMALNFDILHSANSCILVPGFAAGEDFKILCNGKVAVETEGVQTRIEGIRKFNEKQQILSILVGILYDEKFVIFQSATSSSDLSQFSTILFVRK